MEVVVDGIIYELQRYGGISRLYSEIMPRMCQLDDEVEFRLLTSGTVIQSLPRHPRIYHNHTIPVNRILRPWRVWKGVIPHARSLLQKLWLGSARGRIWHSTYYTIVQGWDGLSIVTVVDMIYERFPHLFSSHLDQRFREQKRRCIKLADAIICISDATRRDVQRFYDIDDNRLCTIPLGYNTIFRQIDSKTHVGALPTNKPFLLYVGLRSNHKNFSGLLRAYSMWPARNEVDLVVVGKEWSEDERKELAQRQIAEDQVHLLKCLSDAELCLLYNKAAAFVYPSLYEGFGIPLLEAMACGCPIVGSRIPSTIEVAKGYPIYFDLSEVESLVAALNTAISEGRTPERVQLGAELVKLYSWGTTAQQTLAVYRSLFS